MAQRITGAYRLITVPMIYKGLMRALGSERSIRTYVDDFLTPKPGEKILDVGCGPAQVLHYLPDADYVGIDLNKDPRRLNQLAQATGFEVKTHLFHDLLRIPYDHSIMVARPH